MSSMSIVHPVTCRKLLDSLRLRASSSTSSTWGRTAQPGTNIERCTCNHCGVGPQFVPHDLVGLVVDGPNGCGCHGFCERWNIQWSGKWKKCQRVKRPGAVVRCG